MWCVFCVSSQYTRSWSLCWAQIPDALNTALYSIGGYGRVQMKLHVVVSWSNAASRIASSWRRTPVIPGAAFEREIPEAGECLFYTWKKSTQGIGGSPPRCTGPQTFRSIATHHVELLLGIFHGLSDLETHYQLNAMQDVRGSWKKSQFVKDLRKSFTFKHSKRQTLSLVLVFGHGPKKSTATSEEVMMLGIPFHLPLWCIQSHKLNYSWFDQSRKGSVGLFVLSPDSGFTQLSVLICALIAGQHRILLSENLLLIFFFLKKKTLDIILKIF